MALFYEMMDHTADLGIRVRAGTEAELYKYAVLALSHLVLGQVPSRGARQKTLRVQGEDRVELLVNLLREVLFLFTGEKKVVCGVDKVELGPGGLAARLRVAGFDPAVHRVRHAVKAVTWHRADVAEKDGAWEATIILDV